MPVAKSQPLIKIRDLKYILRKNDLYLQHGSEYTVGIGQDPPVGFNLGAVVIDELHVEFGVDVTAAFVLGCLMLVFGPIQVDAGDDVDTLGQQTEAEDGVGEHFSRRVQGLKGLQHHLQTAVGDQDVEQEGLAPKLQNGKMF